jgi:hypothetical protein
VRKGHLLLLLIFFISYGQYQLKRITFLTPGSYYGHRLVCGDTDNDGLNELIFNIDSYNILQAWEYRPTNHYELAWMVIGGQPPPPGGILVGNFAPNDIGDIDRDSLPDLVGPNQEWVYSKNNTTYYVASTQESPNSSSYPESLNWYYRYSIQDNASTFYFTNDLDKDERKEIMKAVPTFELGLTVWENVGNNQNQIVWNCTTRTVDGFNFTFGDFDLDDTTEFITAGLGSLGRVFVWENSGPDSYELIFVDSVRRPNGSDVFSGKDLDGDGKPEFFVNFAQSVGGNWDFYLYMWETTGNNTYERTLVDMIRRNNFWYTRSRCGDLDGDGIEELVWSTQTHISIYKATGNNQFQRIWEWQNDHAPGGPDVAFVNIYDMNKNGYNEIIVSGSGKISIFEVEAVRLLSPNGGQNFLPGDSVLIQWQKFYPPRCDSFSLSYTTDNGRTYQPILNSIPSTESTYTWNVPNTPSESCRVKVIAYGPGTQFDESDALFTIQPSGLEETQVIDQPLRLEIKPNPFKTKTLIRLNKPTEKLITFKIYNSSGKLVKTLILYPKQSAIAWDGTNEQGKSLPNGVYILKLESENLELIEKLIITR